MGSATTVLNGQGQELLAQGQVLQKEITPRVEKSPEQAQEEPQHGKIYIRQPLSPVCGSC